MILTPSKAKRNRIIKGLTINFETMTKTKGNLVFIQSTKQDELVAVLSSRLFRPQQLMAVYAPRIIRPMNRKTVRVDQKNIYLDIKKATNGRIKIARLSLNAYAGKNFVYDIRPEWNETYAIASTIKQRIGLQKYMASFQEEIFARVTQDVNYEKNYIVFPLVDHISDFRKSIYAISQQDLPPVVMFLKSLKQGTVDLSAYENISEIIFYNPKANAAVVMDIKDAVENFDPYFNKINRLNNFNNGSDFLNDDVDVLSTKELDQDDLIENNKQKIKDAIFKNIAKKLKTDIDDFEPSTKDEEELILKIDSAIDKFIDDPKNASATIPELVASIENNVDVKTKALAFVEGKRIAAQKLNRLSQGMDTEIDLIDSQLTDLVSEEKVLNKTVIPIKADIPKSAKENKLLSIDHEYNEKLANKDLHEVLTSFGTSEYLPMTIDNIERTDSSDDFNEKETIKLKYKTDDGKSLSLAVDIPKIVDERYFYLGGNKKMITKQLVRLPIVKTKSNRVEITTNFNKITIERTNGKISRSNAYLLKILDEYKADGNTIDVVYGENSISNSNYDNDFEYEELATTISQINTMRYMVSFNRPHIEEEISVMNFPEDQLAEYLKDITPIAVVLGKDEFIAIKNDNGEINKYRYNERDNTIVYELVASSIFEFITKEVLNRNEMDKLPTIGKSFVYTKMKILGCAYPVFAVVGIMVGLTNTLKRYKVEHLITTKDEGIKKGYVKVKFKDKYLYYADIPKNTLLFNVLYLMDTENYDMSGFDLSEPYLDFFRDKLGQPMYIRNTLRLNLNVFIDPITRSVLHDLKLPENIIDLLLYANTLLVNNSYHDQNDMRNYRIRGNELVNAILYSLMADAYLNYQRGKLNGKSVDSIKLGFKLNGKDISGQNALITKLVTQSNVSDVSLLSPMVVADSLSNVSMRGHSGVNLRDAFTLETRTYDKSMNGVLSGNATAFSGSVGVTRSLSMNPNITSPRGYIGENVDVSKLDGVDMYSVVELLAPWTTTHADPARQAMQLS